ncbi:hypothetical protein [Ewingella americana]|uniref:hypothetical protein n=1 Tax=Ewingella americana TaxID=41202 RepID=UPI00163ABAC3|nr:hypothetical protein [Ewingella americana]NWA46240.1 hypothetical protein [Pseudomonas reactans]QMV50118.1 hypothetical protein GXP68_01180 [Ewingella americana]
MKELSVVEMNAVSGAGWGPWAGAGVGALAGLLAVALTCKLTNETSENRTQEQGRDNRYIITTATVLGALSGAIAEAR